jgi:hypothetical protein
MHADAPSGSNIVGYGWPFQHANAQPGVRSALTGHGRIRVHPRASAAKSLLCDFAIAARFQSDTR